MNYAKYKIITGDYDGDNNNNNNNNNNKAG